MAGILGVLAALFGTSASAQVAQGIKAYARGDFPAAMRAFEAGAAKGEPQALYNLGVAHAEGRAVPADPARALDYDRQAAGGGGRQRAGRLQPGPSLSQRAGHCRRPSAGRPNLTPSRD